MQKWGYVVCDITSIVKMCEDKPPNKEITTLHTYTTEFNADSVEWCPHEPHQNVFVCANYQLNPGNITSLLLTDFIINFQKHGNV